MDQSTRIFVNRDLRQTTFDDLPLSGKFARLAIRVWGVVCALASIRVEIPRNPGIMGLGAVAATPDMDFLVWTWDWLKTAGM